MGRIMKCQLIVVLAACISTLLSAHATPTVFRSGDFAYKAIELQKPDPEAVARAIQSAIPEPLLPAAPAEGRAEPQGTGRIVDGALAEECQFPHQVALITNFNTFCGGSLISARWVLTAAHCVYDNAQWVVVLAGSTEWATAPVQVYATRAFQHGDYNPIYFSSDVTLLDLGEDLPISECVKPVEIETEGCGGDSLDTEEADVSGWGSTRSNTVGVENQLRWVHTGIVSNEYCRSFYGNISVIDATICSDSLAGANGVLCNGDSGGPLLLERSGRQIGVNSFIARSGCQVGWPSGYARVSCFADWIRAVQAL